MKITLISLSVPALTAILSMASFSQSNKIDNPIQNSDYEVIVLGIAQDGGYPQAGCNKSCCNPAGDTVIQNHFVSSLAIIDKISAEVWLVDCSPDFPEQLKLVQKYFGKLPFRLSGIFLTHAHIGHYLGLAQLGREVMGYQGCEIYAMPRMKSFLENNGPWDQLVRLNNIHINELGRMREVSVNQHINITPIPVPHRDEYSETVGYLISGPVKKLLYIPDIDKWDDWDLDIKSLVGDVDYAFLDATFYSEKELPGRDIEEVPHPFVPETMSIFDSGPPSERKKIYFIHFNHSNHLLKPGPQREEVIQKGYAIASEEQHFQL